MTQSDMAAERECDAPDAFRRDDEDEDNGSFL